MSLGGSAGRDAPPLTEVVGQSVFAAVREWNLGDTLQLAVVRGPVLAAAVVRGLSVSSWDKSAE